MKTLDQLKEEARKIGDHIGRIESAQVRKVNAPLVGKTLKSSNNYSVPEKKSDYWWTYAKVTRMDKWGMLYAFTFETDKYGNVRTQRDNCIHHAQYFTQIPAAEYKRARTKLLATLSAEMPR
jgi:hypothetical protein